MPATPESDSDVEVAIPEALHNTRGEVEDFDKKNQMWKVRLDENRKLGGFLSTYLRVFGKGREYNYGDNSLDSQGRQR